MAHPSVRVALIIREGGSNLPCRWFCRPGIYNDINIGLFRFSANIIYFFRNLFSFLDYHDWIEDSQQSRYSLKNPSSEFLCFDFVLDFSLGLT
jgi:hypothetical protein